MFTRIEYRLNLNLDIPVGTTYADTVVTSNGIVSGVGRVQVHNAGQIAWLPGNYGVGGQGANAYAMQVAIWHEEDSNISIDTNQSTPQEVALYNAYLTNLGNNTGDIGSFLWITPEDASGNI